MFHARKCLALLGTLWFCGAATHTSLRRRPGRAAVDGFCWLAGRLSYATAALLLVDQLAWDSEGKMVRSYLQLDEASTADE